MGNLSPEKQDNVSRLIAEFMSELYSRIMNLLEFVYGDLNEDEEIIEDIVKFANYNFNRTLKHLGYKEVFEGEDVDFHSALKHEVEAKIGVYTNADNFSMVGNAYFMMSNEPFTENHTKEINQKIEERHKYTPPVKEFKTLEIKTEFEVN